MSNTIRLTGLATGLDVDSLVTQMMRAENIKMDKLKQNRQITQWKQELYREIIGDLNTFKSTYFDVLKTDTYMLSDRNYSNFDIKVSGDNPPLSVTAFGNAVAGDYKVTVNRLAEKARIESSKEINISTALNSFSFPAEIVFDEANSSNSNNIVEFNFSSDSTTYSINLLDSGDTYDAKSLSDLAAMINSKLSTAQGGDISKKVTAVAEDGKIRFYSIKTFDADTKLNITDSSDPENVKNYSITVEKGSYSMDQLKLIINEKLKSAKDENGGTAPVDLSTKLSADITSEGSSIAFTGTGITVDNDDILSSGFDITNKNEVTGTNNLEYERKIIAGENDTLSIKVGESQYTLTLDPFNYGTISNPASADFDTGKEILNDLVSKLNNALKNAKDKDGAAIDLTDTVGGATHVGANLSFRMSLDGTRLQIVSQSSHTINVSGNAASTLGLSSSFSMNQGTGSSASQLIGYRDDMAAENTGIVDFVINGVKFKYDFNSSTDKVVDPDDSSLTIIGAKNMSISSLIDDIYSRANVKLSYSQLTRKFMVESDITGASQNVYIEMGSGLSDDTAKVTNDFLSTMFGPNDLNSDGYFDRVSDDGEDASVTIINPSYINQSGYTGITVIKSTNSFTLDGVNYNLNRPSEIGDDGKPIATTVTLTKNSQKSFDKIKEFVEKYNELIDKINEKIDEKKQYSYLPLTDDQKKDMSDDQIEKWEEKAKEGLLSRDSALSNMLYSIRQALYDAVQVSSTDSKSIGITLSGIGITTSSDTTERGKLIIDETKLKNALDNNVDKVAQLFTKVSSSEPYYNPDLTSTERSNRYKEEGIFQRLNDILQDNLRTMRNSGGQKGMLLELAGIKGDYSEFDNTLTDELIKQDKAIDTLIDKLVDKEEKYYLQFSRLEAAMQQLNDQSSWLAQQLSALSGGQ